MKQETVGSNPHGKTPYEKDLYFYHPDHLGTSNYITDTNGKLYEHLEYFPFGEAWVEENSNTQRTPYLFTAKELDEETGLYYFGVRYYDPRTSVWQSPDPIDRFNAQSPTIGLNLYQYGLLNPVRYNDPTGLAEEESQGILGWIQEKYNEAKSRISEAVSGAVGDWWAERVKKNQETLARHAGDDPETIEQSATEHAQAQSERTREAAKQLTEKTVDTTVTVLVTRGAGAGLGGFRVQGQLRQIWDNPRLFKNWLKGTQSLSRIDKPLSHAEARQIIANATQHKIPVDLNKAGLAGKEITGQWAGVPHFKVGNVHIPVQPGFAP